MNMPFARLKKSWRRLRKPREVSIDASRLRVGEIKAVSDEACVVRTEEGVFAFSRFCPHADSDLSNAYVLDGKVRCAWHNLPFDPRTGSQPCKSIRNLRVLPLKQTGANSYTLLYDEGAQ